jgi:hypothetical protein
VYATVRGRPRTIVFDFTQRDWVHRERERAEGVDRDRRSRCETGVTLHDFHVTFG